MSNGVKIFLLLAIVSVLGYFILKSFKHRDMSSGRISDNGLKVLKSYEGFRASVYLDSAGKPTIGYGTLIDTDAEKYLLTKKVTEAEATELMRKDLLKYEQAVNGWVTVPLTQSQFDALVIFAYNVGLGAFQKSSLLKNLNNGTSKPDLANDFLKYVYVTDPKTKQKVVSKGLQKRRNEEINLFLA